MSLPAPPGVIVREAVEADLPALEWDGEYTHFRRVFRLTYAQTLTGQRLMLLAEAAGQVVGQIFAQLRSDHPRYADGQRRGYLYALRTKVNWRERGVGSLLLATAEDRLRARGYEESVIAVAQTNPMARRFYEKRGYRVFLEDPGRWEYTDHLGQRHEVREPAWVLEKPL